MAGKKVLRYLIIFSIVGLFFYNKTSAIHSSLSKKTHSAFTSHTDYYTAFFLDCSNNERSFFKRKFKTRGVEVDVPQILDPFNYLSYITQILPIPDLNCICFSATDPSHPKRGPPIV